MVIVYRSNTGFTREYAEMLGKAEKLKVYSLAQANGELAPNSDVFFMGPLMAGHITGVDQAVKRYHVRGVCGVGMSPATKQVLDSLIKANYVPDAPIFYLQGGWAPKKVGWIKRRMVNMVTRSTQMCIRDSPGTSPSAPPEDSEHSPEHFPPSRILPESYPEGRPP